MISPYEGIEGSEVVATNVHSRLVDRLWGFELAPIGHLPRAIHDPKSCSSSELVQNIPNNPTNYKRVPFPHVYKWNSQIG